MQKHTRHAMTLAFAALLISANTVDAALLYDNGSLINQSGAGSGGADASIPPSGGSTGINMSFPGRLADDFTVPDGQVWHIDSVELFGFQTGSSTDSTFTGLNLCIWKGDAPGIWKGTPVGNPVWGDTTTNRLSSTSFTGDYRVSSISAIGYTSRPIMSLVVDVPSAGTGIELTAGTYWLDWQATGSLSSPAYCPYLPTATAANAQASGGGEWSGKLVDTTNGSIPVDFAFRVGGTVIPEPSTYAALGGAAALLFALWRRTARRK